MASFTRVHSKRQLWNQPMDVGTKELRARLSEILDRVEKGERVVVRRRGKPAAVLTAAASEKPKRLPKRAAARARIKLKGLPMSEFVIAMRGEERY